MLKFIAFAAVALTLTTLGAAEAKAPTGKCRSPKATILAQGPLAVAYQVRRVVPGTGGKLHSRNLVGCLRSTGRKRVLADDRDSFERQARAVVHGSAVGYVTVTISDGVSADDYTVIRIGLLRKSAPKGPGLGQTLDDNRAVGGLDITNRGVIAWVECPDQNDASDCVSERDPLKRVMVTTTAADQPPVELGRGRTIRPRSVRVDHKNRANQRVSWVQEGHRRSRSFPPAPAP